jgi:DHA2 family multidrug resistance protein-like MFS transporter
VVAPLAGILSDKYPAGAMGGIGMTLSITGLISMAFLPVHPEWFDIAWRMSLTGAGFGMYLAPNARLIVGSAPPHRAAAAGGLTSTTRMVGQTSGATLAATLLALGLGTGPVPPLVSASLALIAGICSVARLRPSLRNPPQEEAEKAQPAQIR